jgi:peptide/nickel transport system substrate-binding protein
MLQGHARGGAERGVRVVADLARRQAVFARMLQICEREDPAYIVLHQNAVFTGHKASLPWTQPPSFFMDFHGAWGA